MHLLNKQNALCNGLMFANNWQLRIGNWLVVDNVSEYVSEYGTEYIHVINYQRIITYMS